MGESLGKAVVVPDAMWTKIGALEVRQHDEQNRCVRVFVREDGTIFFGQYGSHWEVRVAPVIRTEHRQRASCYGAIGELQCMNDPPELDAVDRYEIRDGDGNLIRIEEVLSRVTTEAEKAEWAKERAERSPFRIEPIIEESEHDPSEEDGYDATHGRIDADIQRGVDEMNPASLGQRVAMENTLQERRDQERE